MSFTLGKATINWDYTPKRHKNFTDLGNYLIDLGEFDELIDVKDAIAFSRAFMGSTSACTACATANSKGEAIIGRNLDITVSQYPCSIFHITSKACKYETLGFNYLAAGEYTYHELLEVGELNEAFRSSMPYAATDVMNSEGLFLESNMREPDPYFVNTSTNPGKLRVPIGFAISLAAQNCATVAEAVDFITNELDMYTDENATELSGWNYSWIVGDATGEYGLIEVAHNQVSYIRYAHGQGNYYQTPRWNAVETHGSGYGRFAIVDKYRHTVRTEQEMLDLMVKPMWKNELLHMEYAFRDERGVLHFVDENGEESLDWRSDFLFEVPVDEQGNCVESTGFEQDYAAYKAAKASGDAAAAEAALAGYQKHKEYLDRCDSRWVSNDDNFEILQRIVLEKKRADGTLEKLRQYYAGNEKPLRDDGQIWTTSLSYGVNCGAKHLMLKLWEREDCIYEYQW